MASACVVGVLGLVALRALPTHIQAGDAGEFATVMLRGGIPHPSGYPWMRVLGAPARALEVLGVAAALAAALPCALAGIGAWLLVHRLVVRLGLPLSGAFAVLLAALSAPVVLHINDSEVWGLHLLLCALVLRRALDRDPPSPVGLGFYLGLAVSHHLSAILLLPLVVGAAWPRPAPATWRRLLGTCGLGLTGSLIGLIPYLTLASGAGGVWRWGETRTLEGLWSHVIRSDYGVFQLSLHQETPLLVDQITRVLESVGGSLSAGLLAQPLLAAPLLIALLWAATRPGPEGVRPAAWRGLLGSMIASLLLFPAVHNIDPASPFGTWILERFDLLTIMLFCPIVAVLCGRLWRLTTSRIARVGMGVAVAILLVLQGARTRAHGVAADSAGIERYAIDLVETPRQGQMAIVFGTDDHRLFPILYVQEILGRGPQTLYIDASLLSQPWYRRYLRQRWPSLPEVGKPLQLMGVIWSDPARREIPIYMANVFSRPSAALAKVPEGVLWRVVPPEAPATDHEADAVYGRHLAALQSYGGVAASPHPGHPFSTDVHTAYTEGTLQLISALRTDGRHAQADALKNALAELLARAEP
jgi:hypothetical protein